MVVEVVHGRVEELAVLEEGEGGAFVLLFLLQGGGKPAQPREQGTRPHGCGLCVVWVRCVWRGGKVMWWSGQSVIGWRACRGRR